MQPFSASVNGRKRVPFRNATSGCGISAGQIPARISCASSRGTGISPSRFLPVERAQEKIMAVSLKKLTKTGAALASIMSAAILSGCMHQEAPPPPPPAAPPPAETQSSTTDQQQQTTQQHTMSNTTTPTKGSGGAASGGAGGGPQ